MFCKLLTTGIAWKGKDSGTADCGLLRFDCIEKLTGEIYSSCGTMVLSLGGRVIGLSGAQTDRTFVINFDKELVYGSLLSTCTVVKVYHSS